MDKRLWPAVIFDTLVSIVALAIGVWCVWGDNQDLETRVLRTLFLVGVVPGVVITFLSAWYVDTHKPVK